jgi:uncharacterized protein YjcR
MPYDSGMKAVLFKHKTSGRFVGHADELAKRLGIDPSNIRNWARKKELTKLVESSRRVFYFLDEVEKVAAEKAETRKRRGGKPRKSESPAA